MRNYPHGEPVKVEFDGNATTAAAVSIYNINNTARALGATERLLLWSVAMATLSATTIDLYSGDGASAAAGQRLAKAYLPANSSQTVQHSGEPIACPIGVTPKVKSSTAVTVSLIAIGEIIKS